VTSVDNVGRRKWDLAKYKAPQAVPITDPEDPYGYATGTDVGANDGKLVVREPLKRRNYEVDLWGNVGKYTVVSGNMSLSQRGGYYCDVCDCLLKDSTTYLDHINGKKHQRRLGMSMKVERASLAQVKKRLAYHKAKQTPENEIGVEQRLRRVEKEMRRRKKLKVDESDKEGSEKEEGSDKESQKAPSDKEESAKEDSDKEKDDDERHDETHGDEDDPEAAEMASIMGFGAFSASKVKH